MDKPTIIDTPEGIAWFAFLQVLHALRIEVRTGMKFSRGSVLKLAQQRYGVTARTKAGAYDQMCALYEQATGEPYRA